jgi:hypothetical protein
VCVGPRLTSHCWLVLRVLVGCMPEVLEVLVRVRGVRQVQLRVLSASCREWSPPHPG